MALDGGGIAGVLGVTGELFVTVGAGGGEDIDVMFDEVVFVKAAELVAVAGAWVDTGALARTGAALVAGAMGACGATAGVATG